jgi:hypothetical protein
MIGPSNRVPGAHAPQIETALALTAPGQADLADPTTPYACAIASIGSRLRARAKAWVVVASTRFACEGSKQADRNAAPGMPCFRALERGRA